MKITELRNLAKAVKAVRAYNLVRYGFEYDETEAMELTIGQMPPEVVELIKKDEVRQLALERSARDLKRQFMRVVPLVLKLRAG